MVTNVTQAIIEDCTSIEKGLETPSADPGIQAQPGPVLRPWCCLGWPRAACPSTEAISWAGGCSAAQVAAPAPPPGASSRCGVWDLDRALLQPQVHPSTGV